MSLYVYGGIAGACSRAANCKEVMPQLCARTNIVVVYDSLDEYGRQEIDNGIDNLGSVAFYYSIHSPEDGSDATDLWLEASDVASELLEKENIHPFFSAFLSSWQQNFRQATFKPS